MTGRVQHADVEKSGSRRRPLRPRSRGARASGPAHRAPRRPAPRAGSGPAEAAGRAQRERAPAPRVPPATARCASREPRVPVDDPPTRATTARHISVSTRPGFSWSVDVSTCSMSAIRKVSCLWWRWRVDPLSGHRACTTRSLAPDGSSSPDASATRTAYTIGNDRCAAPG